jgi:hypothetical protein
MPSIHPENLITDAEVGRAGDCDGYYRKLNKPI